MAKSSRWQMPFCQNPDMLHLVVTNTTECRAPLFCFFNLNLFHVSECLINHNYIVMATVTDLSKSYCKTMFLILVMLVTSFIKLKLK